MHIIHRGEGSRSILHGGEGALHPVCTAVAFCTRHRCTICQNELAAGGNGNALCSAHIHRTINRQRAVDRARGGGIVAKVPTTEGKCGTGGIGDGAERGRGSGMEGGGSICAQGDGEGLAIRLASNGIGRQIQRSALGQLNRAGVRILQIGHIHGECGATLQLNLAIIAPPEPQIARRGKLGRGILQHHQLTGIEPIAVGPACAVEVCAICQLQLTGGLDMQVTACHGCLAFQAENTIHIATLSIRSKGRTLEDDCARAIAIITKLTIELIRTAGKGESGTVFNNQVTGSDLLTGDGSRGTGFQGDGVRTG